MRNKITPEDLQLFDRRTSARILGIGESTLRKIQKEGLLPTVRVRGQVRIPLAALRDYIAAQTTPQD